MNLSEHSGISHVLHKFVRALWHLPRRSYYIIFQQSGISHMGGVVSFYHHDVVHKFPAIWHLPRRSPTTRRMWGRAPPLVSPWL